MSDIAVRVENISKKYDIGNTSSGSLRETIAGLFSKNGQNKTDDEFWALKDISFEVKKGEAIGIIGKNGAGKSTLLKVLSRITEPTTGRIEIDGRVSSLLEVGTGFHPELTGRENVFLNGTILGMSRAEVKAKFDEIVDFSGVEKFLDTPVKRYSSGMKVRLAFAVAAHLEPEILIIDEVLAVGDAEFQKKCLGKMEDVAGQGRTVLFVSHNMAAVKSLCIKGVLLKNGSIIKQGNVEDAIDYYLTESFKSSENNLIPGNYNLSIRENPYGKSPIIRNLMLFDEKGEVTDTFAMGSALKLSIETDGLNNYSNADVGVIIKSRSDQWLTSINTAMVKPQIKEPREKIERVNLFIPKLYLTEDSYLIDLSIAQKGIGRLDYVENAASINIVDNGVYSNGYRVNNYFGVFYTEGSWEIIS